METGIGAAWAHGTLPPWMEQPPWFDESAAADAADLLAEQLGGQVAATLADQAAARFTADLLAERFGPPDTLARERRQVPRPLVLAELATRRRTPAAGDVPETEYARRRAVLEAALAPTDDPPAVDYGRAA
ncbi:hypothetical protein ACIBTV_27460 [Micromonospora sp. NPDC049366]|uniref:hypothetical protein n=1 Tax=Micromonospora sp. NPDC049366 TaxID=3364271 RepID=UPI0037A41CFA